jgi:hypothetical protein
MSTLQCRKKHRYLSLTIGGPIYNYQSQELIHINRKIRQELGYVYISFMDNGILRTEYLYQWEYQQT